MREKMKSLSVLHTCVILISSMIIAAIMSYIVPVGEFTRIEMGRHQVIDPDSFTLIVNNP